jgi:uncharacterized coiled-coil protein SlyX
VNRLGEDLIEEAMKMVKIVVEHKSELYKAQIQLNRLLERMDDHHKHLFYKTLHEYDREWIEKEMKKE